MQCHAGFMKEALKTRKENNTACSSKKNKPFHRKAYAQLFDFQVTICSYVLKLSTQNTDST